MPERTKLWIMVSFRRSGPPILGYNACTCVMSVRDFSTMAWLLFSSFTHRAKGQMIGSAVVMNCYICRNTLIAMMTRYTGKHHSVALCAWCDCARIVRWMHICNAMICVGMRWHVIENTLSGSSLAEKQVQHRLRTKQWLPSRETRGMQRQQSRQVLHS